jgi:hypothetical protein
MKTAVFFIIQKLVLFGEVDFSVFSRRLFIRQKLSNLPWMYQYLPCEVPGYYGRCEQ